MKGYIYILKFESKNNTLYKVGYASDYNKRLKSYKAHTPFVVQELYYEMDDEKAKIIEGNIHKLFKSSYRREWYDSNTVVKIMNYIDKNNVMIFTHLPEPNN